MRTPSMKGRSRLALLCLSTILCSGLAAPAEAQTARIQRNLDPNGVDVVFGDSMPMVSEGSIGHGDSELELVRTAIGAGDGFSHIGSGGHLWDRISLIRAPGPGGTVITSINKDGKYEIFSGSGTLASGSSLSGGDGSFLYRTSDGTTIAFTNPSGYEFTISNFCNSDPANVQCALVPTSIATPDGKTVAINWHLWTSCVAKQSWEDQDECYHSGRIASISNSSGYRIAFSYASDGDGAGALGAPPPASWQRRTGASFYNDAIGSGVLASTSYSYPSTGVVDVTDTAGRSWRFTGDSLKISAIRRPGAASNTTTYSFSSGAQVSSVTHDGVTTSYSRSVSGNTATTVVTNALSQASTIVSDMTIGRPTSVTNALSQTTGYQYDSYGRLTQITYPEGNKTVYAYDARGNVTSTTRKAKAGSGLADIVTTASYPSSCTNPVTCNSPEWTKDAKGNQTDYTYDTTHGGVLTVTAPADASGVRPQTRYGYTLSAGVYDLTSVSECVAASSCAGTSGETKTAITYGANQLPVSVTQSAGDNSISATTAVTYDAVGNVKTVDGPLSGTGDTTTYRYDSARRVVGIVGPDPDGGGARKPAAQKMTYGNDGLTLKEVGVVDDAGDTAWAAFSSQEQVAVGYDANARPNKAELKSGGTTYAVNQTSYDALGRIECSAQRMNSAAYGSLPSSACSLGTTGSHGPDRIAKTSYDAAGRANKVQSAYGTTEQSDEATAGYTANGRTAYATDAESNKTGYTYDGHDRLVKTEYPSATKGANAVNSSDYEQLTYDANGNVTNRRLRDGTTIGYAYDSLNRLVTKDLPGSEPDVTYTYDLAGRPLSVWQSTLGVGFGYDALGRVTSQATPLSWMSMGYDAAGRRTTMNYPASGPTISYDYDVTGNVTAIRENGATSGIGVLATYAFDNLGRRTGVTFGNGSSQGFGYDAVSRLSTLTNDLNGGTTTHDLAQSFTYNPASQIATVNRGNDAYAWGGHYNVDRSYTANGLNQLTAAGGTALGYDARGNLTSIGSDSFGYSSENRMVTGPGGATLAYDPLGRLLEVAKSGTVTRFDYAGVAIIGEYDVTNTLQRRYVYGPGIDSPIVWYEGSGTSDRRFLMPDERGSIVSVTDSANATIGLNSYDEYGTPAAGNVGRFGYTGQLWLPEVGLWHYKARMYSPTLGRFMQTDPIGYTDGMNWYDYVGGDPVNMVDPFGMTECSAADKAKMRSQGLTEAQIAEAICVYGTASGSRGGIVGSGTGTGSIGTGTGGSSGGSTGATQEPQQVDGPKLCKIIDDTVKKTKHSLPSWIKNSWRWNTVSALKNDKLTRQMNNVEAQGFSSFFNFLGLGSAISPKNGVLTEASAAAGRTLPVIGASSWYIANMADSELSANNAQIAAIDARLNQLDAQKSGCPVNDR